MSNTTVDTARTYAFIGFIFYLIAFVFGLVGSLVSMLFMWAPFIMFFALGLSAIGILFTIWAWITLKDVEAGKYGEARTYSLILGILGLFFAWLIGGIFFLLAYSKLGEISTPPTIQQPLRFCVHCGRAVSPEAKYCSYCGKELPP